MRVSLQRHRSLFSNGFPRTSILHLNQDWFDENDKTILEEKHQKHMAYLSDTSSVSSTTAYSNICKTVQTRLRDIQDSWLSKKADEILSFTGRQNMKKFFDAHKTVYGPQSSGPTPLLSADGTSLLTDITVSPDKKGEAKHALKISDLGTTKVERGTTLQFFF